MAKGGKITRDELISNDAIKAFKDLGDAVNADVKAIKLLVTEARKLNQAMKGADGFQEINKETKQATTNVNKLTAAEKKLQKSTKDLAFAISDEGKKLAILNEKKRRANKANRDFAKSQLTATKSTNKFGVAIKSFLFKANFMANVMANLTSVILRGFVRIMRDAGQTVVKFDSEQTRLASVLQKSRAEIKGLTDDAKKYGSITLFTANQVSTLQVELAKLGFTMPQIKNATEAIIDFATATKSELGDAAKVAAIAINAFGLSTVNTKDVVATLAVATAKSALAFEDLETVLSTVGSTALTYGLTLSETTAFIGKLRDAGFDASKSATAFRNILLNLADTNGALAKSLGGSANSFDEIIDGLITLDARGVDLNETLQLTDKRSVGAFNQFLRVAESVRELNGEVEDANEGLDEMVNTQMKSLEGQITLLKSAWDGFILSLDDGDKIISRAFLGTIGIVSDAITELSNLDLIFGRTNKFTVDQAVRSFNMLSVLNNKMGQRFRESTKEYIDQTLEFTLANEKAIMASLRAAKFSKTDAEAIYLSLITLAKERFDVETQALVVEKKAAAEKLAIAKQAEEAALKKGDTLNILNEQLSEWKKLRNEASIEEIHGVNLEIKALEDKIKKITEATAALPSIKKILFAPDDVDESIIADIEADADRIAQVVINKGEETEATKTRNWIKQLRKGWKQEHDINEKNNTKKLKTEQEFQKAKIELIKQLGMEAFNFLSALTDRQLENSRAAMNEEMAALEEKYKKGLLSESQFEASKLEIERKGQEESLKLRRIAARLDKAMALFNIFLSTKEAVIKYGSNPITAPLIPFVKALGVAQTIAVLAKPIPQFAEGGDIKGDSHSQGGVNINAEGGEFMIKKKQVSKYRGLIEAINNDTIGKEMLFMPGIMGGSQSSNPMLEAMKENNNKLDKLISKPVDTTIIRPGGIDHIRTTRNTTIKRIESFRR